MIRGLNLGNVLVLLGIAGLVTTFFVPSWSASRVARVEQRAQETAEVLHEIAASIGTADPTAELPAIADRLRARCSEIGQPDSDLPELEPDAGPTATFGNRHYLFRIVRRPPPPGAEPEAAEEQPLEVYAWPRTTLPPGKTVFYFPVEGRAAFTRNLSAGYAGLSRAPPPGAGVPRDEPDEDSYRSRDDERWILLRDWITR